MGLYGLHKLKAGLYLHRSGCFLLATDGWGPNENRKGWEVAVLDPTSVGLVIDASWVNGTLRETVEDLDAALASDRRELPEIPTWETTGNTRWPTAASAPEVACPDCTALRGQPCRDDRGRVTGPHRGRLALRAFTYQPEGADDA